MSITKTGVILTTSGEQDKTVEENGSQSSIAVTGLTPSKTYTVSAYVIDSTYGQVDAPSTRTFTTSQCSTPTITDTGSGLSMSVKRYEVRCNVSNTWALSNMEIKWASNAAMTTNVGTYNYALSGTICTVSYNITYRIPASGQRMYIQLTATDVNGCSGVLNLTAQVPMDVLTVHSNYTNSGHTYTFTQSVSPTPPPTAIRANYIQYRIVNTGQAGWHTSSQMSVLTPVELTFEPQNYDVKGYVQDIYGYTQGSNTYQITVADPYISDCSYDAGEIKCQIYFNPDIVMTTCELFYFDGTNKHQSIPSTSGTYTIANVRTGTYNIWVECADGNGNRYTSNIVEFVVP